MLNDALDISVGCDVFDIETINALGEYLVCLRLEGNEHV